MNMSPFKFLQTNDSTNYVDIGGVRFNVGEHYYNRIINNSYYGTVNVVIEPPHGLSRRHWNILPQDLRDGRQEDMSIYIQGWEASRRGRSENPYNLVPYNRVMWNRGFTDYQIRIANQPRTRECAVIAASIRDFNNWRSETFDRSSVFIITNGDFTHTNGNNNQTTRYRAITHAHECRGLMFDDYIITRRTNELLAITYDEYVINHINDLFHEVRLCLRDRNL